MTGSRIKKPLVIFALFILALSVFTPGCALARVLPRPPTHLSNQQIEILSQIYKNRLETERQLVDLEKKLAVLRQQLGPLSLGANFNYLKTVFQVFQKEKALQGYRKQLDKLRIEYRVSDQFQDFLDQVNAQAGTWRANYNPIAIRPESEQNALCGLKLQKTLIEPGAKLDAAAPDSLDWRNYHGENYVTGVKSQGNCGVCWAFASLGAVESRARISLDRPSLQINLAEMDLFCCQTECWDSAGGDPNCALEEIKDEGVVEEACYPYNPVTCSLSDCTRDCQNPCLNWQEQFWKIANYQKLYPSDQNIKEGLYQYGPLVVGMRVYSSFLNYQSGIYRQVAGDSWIGDHAVLLVGYDKDNFGNPYWIGKNSWGASWGEGGFFRYYADDFEVSQGVVTAVTGKVIAPKELPATPTITLPTSTPTEPEIGLEEILRYWGRYTTDIDYDKNGDGYVNGVDFGLALLDF